MVLISKALITAAAALAAFGVSWSAASAAPVSGGVTVVNATADLAGLGLDASPLGDATINANGFFAFPVTGGDLDGLAGSIEHANSGVSLTNGTDVLDLENFLIDTTTQQIFGDVSLNSAFVANAPIFSFDVTQLSSIDALFNLADPSLELRFTAVAASVLFDVYGASGLEGEVFGLAATAPEVSEVPIPAAFGLFAAGAAAFGWAGRRRRAA